MTAIPTASRCPRRAGVLAMTAAALVLCCAPLAALAQAAPRGPADVISGARKARETRELEQAAERGAPKPAANQPAPAQPTQAQAPSATPGTAPSAAPQPSQARSPHGDAAHGGGDPMERPAVASDHAAPSLPDGTLRVHVLEADGTPAAGAEVSVGIMASDGKHSSREAKTGADGYATYAELPAGEKQAYRVNVPYQGAKYSSNPFRLPLRGGYEVEIRRLPVTRDGRMVVLYVGATSVEIKDDRLKIVQQAQLLNIGSATYVFPKEGTLVRLPEGFMAVQAEKSMTDQQVSEVSGKGVRVTGSLPPGDATLLWGFDLPLSGTEASFSAELPWPTFAYRVIADAPPGMTLDVDGMPQPIEHSDAGRHFLVTEMQRKVGDPPFRRLHITLRGIPGPGIGRWIAAALALGVIAAGVFYARKRTPNAAANAVVDFEAHKADVLSRARELNAQREDGEIGPEYHAQQMDELETELAALLFEEARQKQGKRRGKQAPEGAGAAG